MGFKRPEATVTVKRSFFSSSLVLVSDLIGAVTEEYRGLHPRTCPHVEREVVDLDAKAYADRDSLEIVLLNLLGNAARFSREGDVVTLRAARAVCGLRLPAPADWP